MGWSLFVVQMKICSHKFKPSSTISTTSKPPQNRTNSISPSYITKKSGKTHLKAVTEPGTFALAKPLWLRMFQPSKHQKPASWNSVQALRQERIGLKDEAEKSRGLKPGVPLKAKSSFLWELRALFCYFVLIYVLMISDCFVSLSFVEDVLCINTLVSKNDDNWLTRSLFVLRGDPSPKSQWFPFRPTWGGLPSND